MDVVVIVSVGLALVVGALWGLYAPPSDRAEGFVLAIAGGALLVAAISELIEPALAQTSPVTVVLATLSGATVFAAVDHLVDETWSSDSGGGLLAAISLDGIPENLALGVTLIGASPLGAASIAGSIFLSNLPEAAGGAKRMAARLSRRTVIALWVATAVVLTACAVAGRLLLATAPDGFLAATRSFAAGAVIASLATEVFPSAFRDDDAFAGVAAAIGTAIAIGLGELGH